MERHYLHAIQRKSLSMVPEPINFEHPIFLASFYSKAEIVAFLNWSSKLPSVSFLSPPQAR